MNDHYGKWDTLRERGSDHRDEREIVIGMPIEREHETQAGIFEEDQRRERERNRGGA